MYIIAGLGNPGRDYKGTRHNIGFDILDAFAKKHKVKIRILRFRGIIGRGSINGTKFFLVKPLTYMNKSGECVKRIAEYYRINEKSQLIVIADDVSLSAGTLRIRTKGSDGGQKGLKSIIESLGHNEFIRIRAGIDDKMPGTDIIGHVLGHFTKAELEKITLAKEAAVAALECIMEQGVDTAMNRYNTKKSKESDNESLISPDS
ncbi:MAG: aminoacyl-tRNA hydrolase [Lachnospiraceae bacterium]|jgi:PTH1 family peptidyl-tRNA hydrolase|nr:aminoacyl-tRNA hydrolase [Lachnospiraceae bacterium]